MLYKIPGTPAIQTLSALSLFLTPLLLIQAHAEEIPEIIVTANRTANTVDETIAPVTIITRKDIDRLQAQSVVDVLKSTPGVDISTNGGLGSNTSIYMRGTNSDQVLVLVDGVPYGSATLGTTPFQYIPVSQIERIEVVRGPQSSLYGSSAIGGIIQIFTRKDIRGQSFYANTGYGTDSTTESNIGFGYGNETSNINLGIGYIDSSGYDFLGNPDPANADNDDDGFDNTSVSINGYHKFNEQFTLSGSYLMADGENQYDYTNGLTLATTRTRTEFKQQVASIVADLKINDIWSSQLLIGQSKDESDNYQLPFFGTSLKKTQFDTTKDNVSWKNDFIIRDKDILTIGFDYLDESVDSTTDYAEESRWTKGTFTQYQYYGDIFELKAAWRYDDNEQFGSHNTGNIGIGFNLDKHVRVTTSYGRAYRAPTFNQLYYPFYGTADLNPETSESFDFGLNGQFNSVSWSANFYTTSIRNLIATNFSTFRADNINKAKINGLELTLGTELFGWKIQSSYSHTNPENDDTGNYLTNRSRDTFRLDIDNHYKNFTYGASVIAASKRYLDANNTNTLAGYGIMNIRGSWELTKNWTIKAKVDNLFDKEYATTQQTYGNKLPYKAQERFAFASIHYKM